MSMPHAWLLLKHQETDERYFTWTAQILFVVRGGEENKYLQFIKNWFPSDF
jgi:hypothetical protein